MDEIKSHIELSEALNIQGQYSFSESSLSGHNELSILIRECIAESRSAQKKLYDLYAPAAYGVIRRYMYNDEFAAQEILNDSFYKVCRPEIVIQIIKE